MNKLIVKELFELLNPCQLCPQKCGVNRLAGQVGKCRTGNVISVASHNVHKGEEPPISGTKGSGTIFFTNCNLACVFCQNYPISQLGNGRPVSTEKLADIMIELQDNGVHNINFVTPTHVTPWVAEAFFIAKKKGLKIPLVYNSNGYDSVEALKLLDGIIDIYMPDAKYSDDKNANKYSGAINYWKFNRKALIEMHKQVGILKMDNNGIAKKGLLVRHLVLPGNISGSKKVLNFIAKELSTKTYLSLMAQYHPAHQSPKYPEIDRKIALQEYAPVVTYAQKLGLTNGWIQEID